MVMMKTHDSSMKIHRKKLQVLLTMGVFGKPDNVYSSEKPIKGVRMKRFFTKCFLRKYGKTKKMEFSSFKRCFEITIKIIRAISD